MKDLECILHRGIWIQRRFSNENSEEKSEEEFTG